MANREKQFPLWIVTGCAFVLIHIFVVAYFFWQGTGVRKAFLSHVNQSALLVSEIVRLNAGGVMEFQKSIKEILNALLGNTARFVSYLDEIEPFARVELTVFADEAGLSGICIERRDGTVVKAPQEWLEPDVPLPFSNVPGIHFLAQGSRFILVRHSENDSIVMLGVDGARLAEISRKLGLEALIRTLTRVPGISYVRMEQESEKGTIALKNGGDAEIKKLRGNDVAEVRRAVGDGTLVIGIDASHLSQDMEAMKVRFILFNLCLAFIGLCLSFILHRYQTGTLKRVQAFEREIASQKEEASLGRSAATIAHEMRNPLNLLGMGLQRLELEDTGMDEHHKELVRQMYTAVKRANASITGLLNFAKNQIVEPRETCLNGVVEEILDIYRQQARQCGIMVSCSLSPEVSIFTDPGILGQVVDNIVKNAMEAQISGGFLECCMAPHGDDVVIGFKNSGCRVEPREKEMIFEPYFTCRTEGTGLGMAIVKKMMRALGGQVEISVIPSGIIETRLYLPQNMNSAHVKEST